MSAYQTGLVVGAPSTEVARKAPTGTWTWVLGGLGAFLLAGHALTWARRGR